MDLVSSASRTLHLSIDHALAVSYRRNAYDRKTAYVAQITLVKGIPFYGYHVGYRSFFKIYLLNPFYASRLADLLHQGAVMKRPLQPYEAHLQFVPQWMCDYNLYGCAYMDCNKVRFRFPVPVYLELANPDHRWHDRSIPPEDILDDSALQKQSHCPLEVDVCVQDILNRSDVKERGLHHDFGEFLRPAAFNERLVPSVAGLWQDETRRRKRRMGIKDPGSTPFGPDELISMSADSRNQAKGGWVHEDEFQKLAFEIAKEEQRADGDTEISFETFSNVKKGQEMVQTTLESVKDFYPDRLDKSKQSFCQDGDEVAQIAVDGDLARSSQPDGQFLSDGEHSTQGVIHKKPGITENHVIQESFYDGVFDDILLPDDEAPEKLLQEGITEHLFHDGLPVLGQNLSHKAQIMERNVDISLKRSFTDSAYHNIPLGQKKRFWSNPGLTEKNNLSSLGKENPDLHLNSPSSEPKSSFSPKTVQPKPHMPLSSDQLNSLVVKDPDDSLTSLRVSQDERQSKKGHESSQHLQSSFSEGACH